jgi:hypothetical protein
MEQLKLREDAHTSAENSKAFFETQSFLRHCYRKQVVFASSDGYVLIALAAGLNREIVLAQVCYKKLVAEDRENFDSTKEAAAQVMPRKVMQSGRGRQQGVHGNDGPNYPAPQQLLALGPYLEFVLMS